MVIVTTTSLRSCHASLVLSVESSNIKAPRISFGPATLRSILGSQQEEHPDGQKAEADNLLSTELLTQHELRYQRDADDS